MMHIERVQNGIFDEIMRGFYVGNEAEIHAALFIVFGSLRAKWNRSQPDYTYKVYSEQKTFKFNNTEGRMDIFMKIQHRTDPNDYEAIVIEIKDNNTVEKALNQAKNYRIETKDNRVWPTTYVGITLKKNEKYQVAVEQAPNKTGWAKIIRFLNDKKLNLRAVLDNIWA